MLEVSGKYNSAKIFTDVVDQASIAQVILLCSQEFAQGSRIRMMPDIHAGAGCTVGTTMTIRDKVVPNLVGVDIGCGMETVRLRERHLELQQLDKYIRQRIPSGFSIRDKAHRYMEKVDLSALRCYKSVDPLRAEKSLGTLGGGNHFIEVDRDASGALYLIVHSGSRHLGKAICDHFHQKARELNRRWYSEVKEEYHLAFLPVSSREGQQYINWMNLALDYAFENRARMLDKTCGVVKELIGKHTGLSVEFGTEINCHHNYAALENHYDANVWVHRKGATRVREGEMAVIPGAMGSYSYVVEGRGYRESFCTSSHGAGRRYSRSGAMKAFSTEQVMVDLKEQDVVLGKRKKNDVAEECRFAYKDIDLVMAQQQDMVTPVRKLRTVGVVKG